MQPAAADLAASIQAFLSSYASQDLRGLFAAQYDEDAEWDSFAVADRRLLLEEEGGDTLPPLAISPAVSSPRGLGGGARASPRVPPPSQAVHEFLARTSGELKKHPLWKGCSAVELDESLEELERFVMSGVHDSVIHAHPASTQRDSFLAERLASLSFITLSHLDLPTPPPESSTLWELASAALRAMSSYAAPGDKLLCIQSACAIISFALGAMTASNNNNKRSRVGSAASAPSSPNSPMPSYNQPAATIGADEFLPALIYTVIHAAPTSLYSQLKLIAEFRPPNKLGGEQGYYFINVMSAVQFIRKASSKDLNIEEEGEYLRLRRGALKAWREARGGEMGTAAESLQPFLRGRGEEGIYKEMLKAGGGKPQTPIKPAPVPPPERVPMAIEKKKGPAKPADPPPPPPPQGPRFVEGLHSLAWEVASKCDSGELLEAEAAVAPDWDSKIKLLCESAPEMAPLVDKYRVLRSLLSQ